MTTAAYRAAGATLALLLLTSCQRTPQAEIIVLHTGRLAGNIYPLDIKGAPLQHYPYLAGYVNQVRAEAATTGATVLLIDSGDSLTGSFASHATGGKNVAAFFQALQYDALFLGNLDADADPGLIDSLDIPVLCPFLRDDGSPVQPSAPPVQQITRNNLAVRLVANFYGQFDPGENPGRFPMWFGPGDQPVRPVRDYTPWMSGAPPAALTLYHWMKFEGEGEPTDATRALLQSLNVSAVLAHRIYSSGQREVWTRGDYSHWPVPVSENILRHNRGFTLARLDLARQGGAWAAVRPPELLQMTANTAPADPQI
ncbi:MAG: hypothetical protein HC901_04490, partial [Bdellovibrionaceae bacterium]|nr:hypothetical protein [Pseudobdellovibrionaceae bacterium]